MRMLATAGVFFLMFLVGTHAGAETVYLSDLQVANIHPDMTKPQLDKSAGGNAISLGGKTFEHGVGVQAASRIIINLKGAATKFTATVGVDDEVKDNADGGTVAFVVVGENDRRL
jgi:alpha-galactosidase